MRLFLICFLLHVLILVHFVVMFYFCSSENEHKLQALTLCRAAWTVVMLSQMVPQRWGRSESKVLEFRDCLTTRICQCVLGRNPSPQTPSQNTIKHVSNCGTEKRQSCVSVTSANKSNTDPTSHVGKNFRGTAPSPRLPECLQSTTARSLLKEQALVSTFCLILSFCQLK